MAHVERLRLTDSSELLQVELACMVALQNVLMLLHLEILSNVYIRRTFSQLLVVFQTHHHLVRTENAFIKHGKILCVDRVLLVCANFTKVSLNADFFSEFMA